MVDRRHAWRKDQLTPAAGEEASVSLLGKSMRTDAPAAVLLIRLIVGAVFLSEGIQKFLFPAALGAGRFAHIGIPLPSFSAPAVGALEIACGVLLLLGLLTRLAATVMIVNMIVAIATTKIPILIEKGFWAMAHEARTDYSMLLGALFLLVVGAGAWSIDAACSARPPASSASAAP